MPKLSKERLAQLRKQAQQKKEMIVEKMLDPNEITVLSNAQSLINELLQGGQGATEEVAVSKENIPTTDDMEETVEDSVKKELENTPSDSATASDDAETRIDETQTETTEEGVNEVAKAILEVFKGYQKREPVKKANPIVEAIRGIAEVQKSTQDQINDLTSAFANLLDGLGVVEQMGVTKSVEKKVEKSADPITNDRSVADFLAQVLKASGQEVKKDEDQTYAGTSNSQIIRKNLSNANVLKSLIANKM